MKNSITNTLNDQIQYLSHGASYAVKREEEKLEIIKKLREGLKPVRYNDNYIELGGKTYNGWSKEDIEKLNI